MKPPSVTSTISVSGWEFPGLLGVSLATESQDQQSNSPKPQAQNSTSRLGHPYKLLF